MASAPAFPLDLERTSYSYIERPNRTILELLGEHVFAPIGPGRTARVLDVGCGCGANARAVREAHPSVHVTGIEPNPQAADLAKHACTEVFRGTLETWLATEPEGSYDAIILSDVLEHIADPIRFVKDLREARALAGATWVVSVPNYGVWYNRLRTLAGRFDYAWSGLYDRTHLRFYTRDSIRELLEYCGLRIVGDGCTPSLVQSTAPWLRSFFQKRVERGEHLALAESKAFRTYERLVEPGESALCRLWPEMLGFQIVTVAKAR